MPSVETKHVAIVLDELFVPDDLHDYPKPLALLLPSISIWGFATNR